jgi:hypothetical protein
MKKFTQITFNPKGDSYDVFFLDGKLLFQGDYYPDKVEHLIEGIQIFISFMKEEYSRERWNAETKDDSVECWDYDFQADIDETLEKYLNRIERNFDLEKL